MTLRSGLRNRVTRGLVWSGRHASPEVARIVNGALNFIETGRILEAGAIDTPRPAATRFDVFDVAIARAQSAQRLLYLEFGVWEGESIRHWASKVRSPDARFVGFDSFEGLPEAWTAKAQQGAFSTVGQPPPVDDERVSFVKGWFADTVAGYDVPEHDLLVVNIDCDLYSSTQTVLSALGPVMEVGDLLYFDEFHDRLHEGRAFDEFRRDAPETFTAVAATAGASQILFRYGGG